MRSTVQRAQLQPRAFSGIYLTVAADLDAACPGHLLAAIHGGDRTRHAKFLTYAEIAEHGVDAVATRLVAAGFRLGESGRDALTLVARALSSLRPREIVAAVFGSIPEGYLGLLGRIGSDPLPRPSLYRAAWSLYADPRNCRRARLLRQIEGRVSPTKIEAAIRLPDPLLRQTVIDRIHDAPQQLGGLEAFLRQLRAVSNLTDSEIERSLDALKPGTNGEDLKTWARTLLKQQTHLHVPPPIPLDDEKFELLIGERLHEAGREFHNCLATKGPDAFVSAELHYVWRGPPGPAAILTLVPLAGNGWIVSDIKASRNRKPPRVVVMAVRNAVQRYGIGVQIVCPGGVTSLKGIRYMLDYWPCVFDFDCDAAEATGANEQHTQVHRQLDRFIAGINGAPVPESYYDESAD